MSVLARPTAKPSSSDDWPPTIRRPRMSIPYWSVPSGLPAPGGLFSRPRFTAVWFVWYSSGPTKQNRPISTMIAVPVMARLLCRKALKLSCAPPVLPAASPPSGVMTSVPASVGGASSGVAIPDPRVQDAVGDVGGEIAEHGRDANDQSAAQHDREVVCERGLPEQQSHAGEVEDRLSDEGARHDVGQGESENRDDRQE